MSQRLDRAAFALAREGPAFERLVHQHRHRNGNRRGQYVGRQEEQIE
jgi:hypothetical protein